MITTCKPCGNIFGEYDIINENNKQRCPFCSKENELLDIEQRIICVSDDLNNAEIHFKVGHIYDVLIEHEKAFEVIDHNKITVFVYKHEINNYFNRIYNTAKLRI